MKPNSRTIYFYTIFALVYILPLILVNNYYIDDLGRSIEGYGWQHDGRNLSTILMQLLSFGGLSVDLFPYTIIMASLILAFSGYYITQILDLEQHQQIRYSGLLLLTGPFMLENLSYRWDSLTMSISIISTIVPFLYICSYKKFIPASIVGILVCLFTFQASVVIYGLIIICLIITYCLHNKPIKNIIYILVNSLISIIVAFILYMVITKLFVINYNNRNLTVLANPDPLEILILNFNKTFELIQKVFNLQFTIIFVAIIVIFLIALIKHLFSKCNIRYKLLALSMIIMIPFGIIFIAIIPQESWITPRVFVGFCFLFYSLLIYINYYSERLCKFISIILLLTSFPLMAAYTNSLKNQKMFEDFLVKNISTKIKSSNKILIFDGIEPWAPELQNVLNNFPITSVLVPRYMENNWYWSAKFFEKNTYLKIQSVPIEEYIDIIKSKHSIPMVHKTPYYTLRENDSIIIVDFKK